MSLGDWATWVTAFAEFLVAWVIYRELKGSREAIFLEQAFGKQYYHDRRQIYLAYLGNDFLNGGTKQDRERLWHRSKQFEKEASENERFAEVIQDQITHMNMIAVLYGKRNPIARLFGTRHDTLVQWFPHAVVWCWIILGPHILKRASSVGHYWSAPLIDYTLACVDLIDSDGNAQLVLRGVPNQKLIVSKPTIAEIRNELKKIKKARSRLDVEEALRALNDCYGSADAQPDVSHTKSI